MTLTAFWVIKHPCLIPMLTKLLFYVIICYMFLPIRIKTDSESLLLIKVAIPLFFKFKIGFKPDIEYSDNNKQIQLFTGEEKSCLHVYVAWFRFRVRSNTIMGCIKEHDTRRFLFNYGFDWVQVFDSCII